MRFLFALPGFHLVERGAETALLSVASKLADAGHQVNVVGGGSDRVNVPYKYWRIPITTRERFERFPKFPPLRSAEAWEDASFASRLRATIDRIEYDVSVTCSYPFTNWALSRGRGKRGKHIFVTQNGDWPAFSDRSEYRFFNCDGLICTNPDYFERNNQRWTARLIPNGIDLARFTGNSPNRERFRVNSNSPAVLMVSALIESKRVRRGVEAVAELEGVQLIVAGDGPLRDDIDAFAQQLLGERYRRLTVPSEDMPLLYASVDCFLHLSKTESFGNVFVEAMASGLPVVAHDLKRTRWIVGDNPFFCNTDDQDALVSTLRAALSAGSRSYPSTLMRFDRSVVAQHYAEFAEAVLG